jgi:hypothetical protein
VAQSVSQGVEGALGPGAAALHADELRAGDVVKEAELAFGGEFEHGARVGAEPLDPVAVPGRVPFGCLDQVPADRVVRLGDEICSASGKVRIQGCP